MKGAHETLLIHAGCFRSVAAMKRYSPALVAPASSRRVAAIPHPKRSTTVAAMKRAARKRRRAK